MKTSLSILFILLICSCSDNDTTKTSRVDTLPYYNDATFTPHWFANDSDSLINFHCVPAFTLINQDGDTITEETVENKIYVTDFFFTSCPGICPKMTNNMLIIQNEFINDSDVVLISHSVTPERDSVPALKTYAESKGVVSGKWHLVTGSQKEIYALGRNSYFVEEDLGIEKDETDFLHTENFVLVDQDRRIRGIYNGLNKASIDQLIADMKTLKKELAQ